MTNYTNFNELWEKNLENMNAFTGVMKDEATKAIHRQTQVVTEGINMGVNLTNNMVEEFNKNIVSAGEVWGDVLTKTFKTETTQTSTRAKASKE